MPPRLSSPRRAKRAAEEPDAASATLTAFAAAWAALAATLPAHARVRMEGTDPDALPLRQAAFLALGYPAKWATFGSGTTFECPPLVAAHFASHATALTALGRLPVPAQSVKLGLVGDCMWLRDSWTDFLTPPARTLLESCAALLGNLETPLHEHTPRSPAWLLQSLLPDMVTYSSPATFLRAFERRNGPPGAPPLVGAFTTANNHSADMGPVGARQTLAALEAAGIPHCGIRSRPGQPTWCSFERAAGLAGPACRVGVYAATFGVNFPAKAAECLNAGVTIQIMPGLAAASAAGAASAAAVDLSEAQAALADMAAAGCGLRVVSMHWGHEFEGYPTACQMAVARALVRAGADVILGAHSHVAQPAEVLLVNGYTGASGAERRALKALPAASRVQAAGPARKALVLYSLGNFCSTMFNELCRVGLLLTVQLAPPASEEGPWTWHLPTWHWLYNEAHVLFRPPGSTRRLLLAGASPEAALPQRKRAFAQFAAAHVLGGPARRVLPRMGF